MIAPSASNAVASDALASSDRPRVVLFGASNLTSALPLVVAELRRDRSGAIDLLSAHGHGRSYGLSSRILGRELPSILECGLWRALDELPRADTDALLCDIGNDIAYGATPDAIAAWIGECLRRLSKHRAHVAIARLPIAGLKELPRWRFEIVRALLFPTHRISHDVAIARACELDLRIGDLAREHGAALIDVSPSWYGLDPIHIRRGAWPDAWRALLSAWPNAAPAPTAIEPARLDLRDRMSLSRARQEERTLFGIERAAEQPSAVLTDGTTIRLY